MTGEVREPLEAVLADAALAGRISWQAAERALDQEAALNDPASASTADAGLDAAAATAFDAYQALGGRDPEVGLSYFRGRIDRYDQPEAVSDANPEARRWAELALGRHRG